MATTAKNGIRNRALLVFDTAMLIAFLIATSPQIGGLAVHEWLGIACAVVVIVHLLVNWQWIISCARQLITASHWQTKVNYLLNILLYIDVTLLMFTGIMISEVALRAVGITLPRGMEWRRLHEQTSDLFLVLVGLHTALHWDWIVTTVRRLVGRPRAPKLSAAPAGEEA